MQTQQAAHTCKNCGNIFTGTYCNQCGEKHYTDHDKSIKHILEEAVHFLTHFEGKLFTSLKTIVTMPGKISLDYCHGIRKKYFPPTSLYLIFIVILLAFPTGKGLDHYPNAQDKSTITPYANKVMQAKMEQTGQTREHLGETYYHKAGKLSKILLLLLLPVNALVLLILYKDVKRPFFDHFIIATEIATVILVVFYYITPLLQILAMAIGTKKDSVMGVIIGSLLYHVPIFTFNYLAFRRFYKVSATQNAARTVFYYLTSTIIMLFLYQFLLITIVMWLL